MHSKLTRLIIFLFCVYTPLTQGDEQVDTEYGHLSAFEPMYVGYRWDEDDVPYMDFKLSMKYPLLHSGKPSRPAYTFLPYPYFAFSTRMGQYIGTRESSPVISKRFNPELFGRYWLTAKNGTMTSNSVDLIYGHESNGQNVNTYATFIATALEMELHGEDIKYAKDYLSRGWDYTGIRWNQHWKFGSQQDVITFLQVRYFLDHGLMQGDAEECYSWEDDPECKPRRQTDGLSLAFKRTVEINSEWIQRQKIFLKWTTGLEKTFQYNTLRAELSFTAGNLPLMIWASYGYNSDLIDYYRQLSSGGIAIEFTNW